MAGYNYIGQVQDPAAQRALRDLASRVAALTTRVETIESTAIFNTVTINANNQRITSVAAPAAETDAVTVTFLRQYIDAQLEAFKGP